MVLKSEGGGGVLDSKLNINSKTDHERHGSEHIQFVICT